jgi:predicted CXXCH cytochrome family protein
MFRKLVGLTTFAVSGLFLAGTASAAISGSKHDLSTYDFGTNGSIQEICVVCHAPHNNGNAQDTLLWNRVTNTTTYTPYDSPSLDDPGTPTPGATSMLCLGCHDGTVAVDSYGGATGTNFIDGQGGDFGDVAAFDANLSNDHPIGITYISGTGTIWDSEMHTPSTKTITYGSESPTTGGFVSDLLYSNKVECASCHDVHNTKSAGNLKLLNVTNDGSTLCLSCHNK